MSIKTNIKHFTFLMAICCMGWFYSTAYASIASQNCSYQEQTKPSYEYHREWTNKYLQAPSFLYKQDQSPKAMMPMDLPGIFTNPLNPKPVPSDNTPEEIIPTPGG